jgi:hypothetical protein
MGAEIERFDPDSTVLGVIYDDHLTIGVYQDEGVRRLAGMLAGCIKKRVREEVGESLSELPEHRSRPGDRYWFVDTEDPIDSRPLRVHAAIRPTLFAGMRVEEVEVTAFDRPDSVPSRRGVDASFNLSDMRRSRSVRPSRFSVYRVRSVDAGEISEQTSLRVLGLARRALGCGDE